VMQDRTFRTIQNKTAREQMFSDLRAKAHLRSAPE
jgi:hypothetical protein